MKCKNLVLKMIPQFPGVENGDEKCASVECGTELERLGILPNDIKRFWCPECGNFIGVKV